MIDRLTSSHPQTFHVLMTADAVGGVWTYALALASVLRGARVRFTLAVMGPVPSPKAVDEAEALLNVTVNARAYRLEWMPDADGDVDASGRWLLRLAERIQPDLVHINGYAHASLPFEQPVLTVAHSCVRSWWRAVKREPAPAEWDEYSRRVREGLDASTMVAAPTRAMANALRHEYAFSGDVSVVPNGLPALSSPPRTQAKEPIVFTAGRFWDDAKNLAMLEKIAPHLPWLVLAAGSLETPDGRVRVPRQVRHVGHLDRAGVAKWMSRAAIYAHPARYEPFGLSVLEAAQAGCALVLGDIPSLREVWRDAAIYVDPSDHTSLREAIRELAADEALRCRLALAARARAAYFSDVRMGHAYLALYRHMANTTKHTVNAAEALASPRVIASQTKAAPCV
jgi:glycogen(starch) synthase